MHARTSYYLLLQYMTPTVKINSSPLQNHRVIERCLFIPLQGSQNVFAILEFLDPITGQHLILKVSVVNSGPEGLCSVGLYIFI